MYLQFLKLGTLKAQRITSPLISLQHIMNYGTTGSSSKGGCGFYVNSSLSFIPRPDLNIKVLENNSEFESSWVEILNGSAKNMLIGVFYRHPSLHDDVFNKKLKTTLRTIKKENKKVIICGDFNLNLLEFGNDDHTSNFLNLMLEFNYQPCITEPTRITNTNKPTLIDNIFINTLESPLSGNILEHVSYDHLPNFIIIEHEQTKNLTNIKKRDTKNFNENNFLDDLKDPALLQNILNAHNTNSAFEICHSKFLIALEKHAPMKYLSKKEIKTRRKPWITSDICASIKSKRALFRKFKNQKLAGHVTDNIYLQYKASRDHINTLKRKSKRNFYKEYFTKNINNSKKTWKGINQLLNRSRNNLKPVCLEGTDGITSDPRKVANKFNQYFVNVADDLTKKITNKNTKFQDYLKNPNRSSLFLKETTPDEVNRIISDLNANKSSDIYDISPKYIIIAGSALSTLLTIIFNKSIAEGVFPDKMKTAKIIPIHKGDSVLQVSNYRPISLFSKKV